MSQYVSIIFLPSHQSTSIAPTQTSMLYTIPGINVEPKETETEKKPFVCQKCGKCYVDSEIFVSHTFECILNPNSQIDKAGSIASQQRTPQMATKRIVNKSLSKYFIPLPQAIQIKKENESPHPQKDDSRTRIGQVRQFTFRQKGSQIDFTKGPLATKTLLMSLPKDLISFPHAMQINNKIESSVDKVDSSKDPVSTRNLVMSLPKDQTDLPPVKQIKREVKLSVDQVNLSKKTMTTKSLVTSLPKQPLSLLQSVEIKSEFNSSKCVKFKKKIDKIHSGVPSKTIVSSSCLTVDKLPKTIDTRGKKKHQCDMCESSFSRAFTLSFHLRSVHKVTHPFTCNICKESFRSKREIDSHSFTHRELVHQCEKCQKECKNYKSMVLHMKHCQKHTCEVCNKGFSLESTLHNHLQFHPELRDKYKCDVCQKGFLYAKRLAYHKTVQHIDNPEFHCNICGKAFDHAYFLRRHIVVHAEPGKYRCKFCNKGYSSQSGLDKHHKTHPDFEGYDPNPIQVKKVPKKSLLERPYPCTECDEAFLSLSKLETHKFKHMGPRPHICEICKKGYPTRSSLKYHRMNHGGDRPFPCDSCDKKYFRIHDLRAHYVTHSGLRPYPCQICGKGFSQRNALKDHHLLHTGEMPYECDSCEKKFRTKRSRQLHFFAVHGEKPYTCPYCGRRFSEKSLVKRHAKTLHGITLNVLELQKTSIED